MWEALGQL
ncbi:rCG22185 [Rattus norvegicus]|uniref:RCG22185 n=1 Tax=Rattus norvegicus TaxID=10116 RepID=A6INU1_RAT|nr:rCG22185 [Rattus norvegicus]